MAVGMRCDNCEKFFEYEKNSTNAIRFSSFVISSTGLVNGYSIKETYDLCPDCIEAVKNAMNERKAKKK